MELQYFCHPSASDQSYDYWVDYCHGWLLTYGLSEGKIRKRKHEGKELAHYAIATTDLEFEFPFGWGELWGIANRGDYDLNIHAKGSGNDLSYTDPITREVRL